MKIDNTKAKKEGVQKKSIEKIWNFIENENKFITISEISKRTHLHIYSVKSCLDLLDNFGKIEVVTNGRTTLIKKKEDKDGAEKRL